MAFLTTFAAILTLSLISHLALTTASPTPALYTRRTAQSSVLSSRSDNSKYQNPIITGVGISIVCIVLLIAAFIVYRKRPRWFSSHLPVVSDNIVNDKGFKTNYWSAGNAPANHPMLGEAGMGMLHVNTDGASSSRRVVGESPEGEQEGLLNSAAPIDTESFNTVSIPPPPIYTEQANDTASSAPGAILEVRPASVRPRSVAGEGIEQRDRSRDREGLGIVIPRDKLDRSRSRSVSRFREESMTEVDVSDSMSIGMNSTKT